MAVYKTPTFQLAWESKCCLNAECKLNRLFIPPSHQKPVINAVCAGWALFPHALPLHLSNPNCMFFPRTLTDMYDGVRFSRIALQYPQGKADQQQLHLGISARRLIQAPLCCPILSKWSNQRKKKEKKMMNKTQWKQNRGPPPGRPDPHENLQTTVFSLSLSVFFKPTEANRPQEGGLKKTRKYRRGPEVRLKRQVARWERPVASLTLTSLPALRRLKHGKQQKMRRRDTPLTTHGDAHIHTQKKKKHSLQSCLDHVTAETSRLGCCPVKPARNDLD